MRRLTFILVGLLVLIMMVMLLGFGWVFFFLFLLIFLVKSLQHLWSFPLDFGHALSSLPLYFDAGEFFLKFLKFVLVLVTVDDQTQLLFLLFSLNVADESAALLASHLIKSGVFVSIQQPVVYYLPAELAPPVIVIAHHWRHEPLCFIEVVLKPFLPLFLVLCWNYVIVVKLGRLNTQALQ